jgi:hypothetical protein
MDEGVVGHFDDHSITFSTVATLSGNLPRAFRMA